MLSGVLAKFTEWQTAAEGLLDGYLKGDIILSDFAQEVAQTQATKKQQDSQQGLKSGQQAQQADTSPAKPSTLSEAAGGDAPSRVHTKERAIEPSLLGEEQPYRSSTELHESTGAVNSPSLEASLEDGNSSGEQGGDEAVEKVSSDLQPQPDMQQHSTANGAVKPVEAVPSRLMPEADPQEQTVGLHEGNTKRGYLTMKTLKQLLKSALSIELDVGDLPARLLHALKLQQWRFRASAALAANTKYTGGWPCLSSMHWSLCAYCNNPNVFLICLEVYPSRVVIKFDDACGEGKLLSILFSTQNSMAISRIARIDLCS